MDSHNRRLAVHYDDCTPRVCVCAEDEKIMFEFNNAHIRFNFFVFFYFFRFECRVGFLSPLKKGFQCCD